MPTYDYKCKNCGHELEAFHAMNAESLVMCPKCNTPNLVRIISTGAGMIFKGSGFYLTDYKKTNTDTKESKPKVKKPAEKKPSTDPKPDTPAGGTEKK